LKIAGGSEDIWCNENENDPTSQCVFIKKKNLKNGSLCLSRLQCYAEMPFICDSKFIKEMFRSNICRF
jgi:hypothetical protein